MDGKTKAIGALVLIIAVMMFTDTIASPQEQGNESMPEQGSKITPESVNAGTNDILGIIAAGFQGLVAIPGTLIIMGLTTIAIYVIYGIVAFIGILFAVYVGPPLLRIIHGFAKKAGERLSNRLETSELEESSNLDGKPPSTR